MATQSYSFPTGTQVFVISLINGQQVLSPSPADRVTLVAYPITSGTYPYNSALDISRSYYLAVELDGTQTRFIVTANTATIEQAIQAFRDAIASTVDESDDTPAAPVVNAATLKTMQLFLADDAAAKVAGTEINIRSADDTFWALVELTDDSPRMGFVLPGNTALVGVFDNGVRIDEDDFNQDPTGTYTHNFDIGAGWVQYLIRTRDT